MGEAQQVTMAHALAPAVLDRLIGELLDILGCVPAPDRAPQRAAPAAEALDEPRELKQMRSGPADSRQRIQRGATSGLIAETRARGQRKHRRLVLGRPTIPADRDDLRDRPRTVRLQAANDGIGVLTRELALADVVAPALGAEDQETTQASPVIDGPREAAGAVGALLGTRDRLCLRGTACGVLLQVRHGSPPFR